MDGDIELNEWIGLVGDRWDRGGHLPSAGSEDMCRETHQGNHGQSPVIQRQVSPADGAGGGLQAGVSWSLVPSLILLHGP